MIKRGDKILTISLPSQLFRGKYSGCDLLTFYIHMQIAFILNGEKPKYAIKFLLITRHLIKKKQIIPIIYLQL